MPYVEPDMISTVPPMLPEETPPTRLIDPPLELASLSPPASRTEPPDPPEPDPPRITLSPPESPEPPDIEASPPVPPFCRVDPAARVREEPMSEDPVPTRILIFPEEPADDEPVPTYKEPEDEVLEDPENIDTRPELPSEEDNDALPPEALFSDREPPFNPSPAAIFTFPPLFPVPD